MEQVNQNIDGRVFVDIEGKKVHLPEGYALGLVGVSDLIKMAFEYLKGNYIYETMTKSMSFQEFYEKLKSGDPEVVTVTLVSVAIGAFLFYKLTPVFEWLESDDQNKNPPVTEKTEPLRDFTVEQLREFNGTKGKPIYVGLCREVFDVSSASMFYGEGAGYHCFAGREATRAMAKLSFEESDLASLKDDDFGPFEKNTLEDWYQKFKYYKSYPVVGRVSIPPAVKDFTKAELKASKESTVVPEGRIDAPMYLGIKGKVIDVSYGGKDMYGPDSAYNKFIGIDASRALAKMSFDPADLESSDLSDLTPEQLKTLDDWVKKFVETKKYPVVGRLVD
jgi:membrane-associated progesterone receptor component